ncbi:MAG TPA: EamA family transporter [Burkholderiales bacterium]|nr:EamA family transporter [Burkholderiales bacterium]
MQTKAFVQSLAAILLWSVLAFLALRLSRMPPFLLVGAALLIGSLCGVHNLSQWRVSWRVLLLGVYGIFGFHFCLFLALRYAPPVEANLINYLWPLSIVVLSPLFLRGYVLRMRHIVAALLGFTGAMLIVTGGDLDFRSEYALGYLLAGVSAFIWSSYSLMTMRVDPFPNAAIGLFCFVAGALSLAMHFVLEPAYIFSASDFVPLLVLGLGPMGAAFFLWDAALKNGDPRIIGSLAYLTPMLSTLILASTGSGRFTLVSAVAMFLIVGGAVVGSVSLPLSGRRAGGRGSAS